MSFFSQNHTEINSDDWTITKKTTRTIKHENFSKMKNLKVDRWALSLTWNFLCKKIYTQYRALMFPLLVAWVSSWTDSQIAVTGNLQYLDACMTSLLWGDAMLRGLLHIDKPTSCFSCAWREFKMLVISGWNPGEVQISESFIGYGCNDHSHNSLRPLY